MNSETVWKFAIGSITVCLHIERDYGHQYDGHDPRGATQRKLDSGQYVAFDSTVEIIKNGHIIGSDSLGSSVYAADDMDEFWTAHRSPNPMHRNCSLMRAQRGNITICHYFPDMVRQAVADARATLSARVDA